MKPAASRFRIGFFSAGLAAGTLAGVCLVLLLAPCSREVSSLEEKGPLDDLVLGKVAGIEFTVADLRKKLKYQYGRVAEKGLQGLNEQRSVASSAIDEWCWVKLAEKKGYTKDPRFRDTWELSRRYILANRTIDLEIAANTKPTEEEIQAYFEQHATEYQMPTRVQVAHVQTGTRAQAEAARQRLLKGDLLADVVRAMTIDETTRAGGGMIGWITETSSAGHLGMIPAFNEAAMHLQKGEVSQPIELGEGRGWSVLYAVDRTEAGPRPMDDALRETVAKRVQTRKHNDLFDKTLGQLKQEYGAEFYDENFDRYATSILTEEELFMMAQREKDSSRRLRVYQLFGEAHPESPYAPQAMFMVGFTQADEQKAFDKARASFQAFVQKYPDHELVPSANWMLENMDKPNPDMNELNELRRKVRTGRLPGQ
jgi:peptidyl-prolyl cis-trans isomerase C